MIVRIIALPVAVEGLLMLLCAWVGMAMGDATAHHIVLPAAVTTVGGTLCYLASRLRRHSAAGRMAYLGVTLLWIVLASVGTIPLLASGSFTSFTDAFFESMAGFTTAGASLFGQVEQLPACIVLWRSLSQWIGGFGIVLLVLAVVPTLGIGSYSLYTAEISSADNTAKLDTSISHTIRHTLTVYVSLTVIFIALLVASGLMPWQAVNLTFTHISSGGFALFNDGIASLSHTQQLILLFAMMLSGINFAFLYLLFSLKFKSLRQKLDQLSFYLLLTVAATAVSMTALHYRMHYGWSDALRLGALQSASAITTTGTMAADTRLWWPPLTLLFLLLALCGGMAGSTSGGIKAMRVLILLRNVKKSVLGHLHPHAVDPVRLNGKPLADSLVTNVMVIFFVYLFTLIGASAALLLTGMAPIEAVGDAVACLSGYGPGLATSGGFGSYAHLPSAAKLICSLLMLLGRLECIPALILLTPAFWKR